METIEQAIIPVAGFGTRRLPITKAIEKCMLPIGDRPMIDYVVEDYLKAGVEDITFVVSDQSQQLRTYYGNNQALENYLVSRNKLSELEQVTQLGKKATFHYVVQDETMPYGTAVPISLCSQRGGFGDRVLVSMGDELVYNRDGSSETRHLIDQVSASTSTAGLLVTRIPLERVSSHGVLELTDEGKFSSIVDQPQPEEAPSNLINVSRYLLDRMMLNCVDEVMSRPPAPNGEYQLTEALNIYVAEGRSIEVVEAKGRYLDGGTTQNWLDANNYVLGGI